MSNYEKYCEIYVNLFEVDTETSKKLSYQSIKNWDSIGHMALMTEVEEAFDIMLDTDDIINFSSFEIGIDILKNYDVEF